MRLRNFVLAFFILAWSLPGQAIEYISLVDGTAFYYNSALDLSEYQTGGYRLVIEDSTGKVAYGFISATPPAGETLGSESVINGDMELDANWINYTTPVKNERSLVQAHGGTYSRHIETDGQFQGCYETNINKTGGAVYKGIVWAYGDGANRWTIRIGYSGVYGWAAANVIIPASWTAYSVYYTAIDDVLYHRFEAFSAQAGAGHLYIDDASIKQVTDPPSTGARIIDGTGGQNWEYIESGFNPNASLSSDVMNQFFRRYIIFGE